MALLLAKAVASVPTVMKTAVNVKLLLPPRQSRGNSLGHLASLGLKFLWHLTAVFRELSHHLLVQPYIHRCRVAHVA